MTNEDKIKIAEKIKLYRNDWRRLVLETLNNDESCHKMNMAEMRYQTYLMAVQDVLGFDETCDILKLTHETVKTL